MIKVSVIVPVYNTEKYLERCLNSLVNQTLNNIEIIIINDGSTDNSQKIIDKYVKKYKNIKSYIKKNGGLSDTRNYGIDKSIGEYLFFVDSDDYIKIDALEKLYNHATSNKLDIVVCDSINLYDDGREILIKSNLEYTDNKIKKYLISPPMACVRLIKRTIFNNQQFKKDTYYEDLELTPKLVLYTNKIDFYNEGLYYYYQRKDSIMHKKIFNDKLLDIFTVLDSNKEKLEKEYKEEIEYMYISHLLRTATLRFLEYDNCKQYLLRINKIIKDNYSNWRKNIYYKKSSNKMKLLCILAYYKQYLLLKIIKKVSGR